MAFLKRARLSSGGRTEKDYLEDKKLREINNFRASMGLKPLVKKIRKCIGKNCEMTFITYQDDVRLCGRHHDDGRYEYEGD